MLAAVYGVPDDQAGDQVMAGLVLRDGATLRPGARSRGWLDGLGDVGPKWRPRYVRVLARPADDRHQQDREAHARAPEVAHRPGRRRRRLRARPRRATRTGRSPPADEQALRDAFERYRARPLLGPLSRGPVLHAPRSRRSPPRSAAWLDDEPRAAARASRRSTTRSRGVAAWQAKLAADRWVGIHWPAEYGGRGASPVQVAIFNMEYARSRALQPVNRVGINLAGPDAARARHRRAEAALAAVDPRRERDLVPAVQRARGRLRPRVAAHHGASRSTAGGCSTGQKVWTSYAQFARWGICLARTDPERAEAPRASRYLVVDMEAPGIEIRPLVQITGEAEFNEVFFDDVFVPEDHLVGGLHQGWAVANTTLAHERGTAFPFKEQVVHEVYLDELYALAARARRARRRRGRRRARAVVRRAAGPAAAQLAHAVAPGAGHRARARSRAG